MVKYEPFGELYDNKPRLHIAERLRHCRTAIDLARTAIKRGYNVEFVGGSFRHDARISSGPTDESPMRSYTMRSAKQVIESSDFN